MSLQNNTNHQIYQLPRFIGIFLWLDIFTDQKYWYFSLLQFLTILSLNSKVLVRLPVFNLGLVQIFSDHKKYRLIFVTIKSTGKFDQ